MQALACMRSSVASVVAVRTRFFIDTSDSPWVRVLAYSHWLYLTSDRRLAPLPFPVPSRLSIGSAVPKMALEGSAGTGTTQKGPELCATCVTVVVVTTSAYGIADIPDVTIAYAIGGET
jgi:hypothetical protein